MSSTAKLEADIMTTLDRVENRSTREVGLRSLQDIIQTKVCSDNIRVLLKLVFSNRNRSMWKVLIEPITITLIRDIAPSQTVTELLKYLLSCLSEPSCHTKSTEMVEKLYRQFRDESILCHLIDTIPFNRSPGLAMCLLNISSAVTDLGLHVENFALSLFRLRIDNRYLLLYNEWILSFGAVLSQGPASYVVDRADEICRISVDCSKILSGESTQIRLTRDVAMGSCVFLSVVPQAIMPCTSSLISACPNIVASLSRSNLQLFALTRCFPKLRTAISSAHTAWAPYISSSPPNGRNCGLTRSGRLTAESIRTRVIENVVERSNPNSPERLPPVPHTFTLEDQETNQHENSFNFDTNTSVTTSRWDIDESHLVVPPAEQESPKELTVNRRSFNAEFNSIVESGNEDDLIELLFVHQPPWSIIIDDNHVTLLFHLLVELLKDSQDSRSIQDRVLEYLEACDERVVRFAAQSDIVNLRTTLLELCDWPRARKLLQCMYAQ